MVRSEGPAAGREVTPVVVSLAAVIQAAADPAEVIQVAAADMAVAEVMAAVAATDITERPSIKLEPMEPAVRRRALSARL